MSISIALASAADGTISDAAGIWICIGASAGFVVLLAAIVAWINADNSRQLASVAALRPGAFVFATYVGDNLAGTLQGTGYKTTWLALYLLPRLTCAVDASGISLWRRGHDRDPVLSVPWAQVDHVEIGSLTLFYSSSSSKFRTLRVFRSPDSASPELPLPITSGRAVRRNEDQLVDRVLDAIRPYTPATTPPPFR